MNYRQLNAEERSVLAAMRTLGLSQAEIARKLGRHRSTICFWFRPHRVPSAVPAAGELPRKVATHRGAVSCSDRLGVSVEWRMRSSPYSGRW